MVLDSIRQSLVFPVFLVLFLSLIPLFGTEATESNNVFTELEEDAVTEVRFDPSEGTGFTIVVYSEFGDQDIHMNFSAVDGSVDYDPGNWEVVFDPLDFTVYSGGSVTVSITVTTNLTEADKGRSLDLTVWGDVVVEELDDVVTNSQEYHAIIAERDDVELSVSEEYEERDVHPNKETRFNVYITNTGWSVNSIRLTAKILDEDAPDWTVRVIYTFFDNMDSGETRVGTINVTSPEITGTGDYTLEVKALAGAVGSDSIDLTAHVPIPDLQVKEIVASHDPALHGTAIQIRALIKNDGGHAEDFSVRAQVKGHRDQWIFVHDVTVESVTNYNETYVYFDWEVEMTDKNNFTETWTIRVMADDQNSVVESDEGNNQGEKLMVVRAIEKTTISFNPAPALIILGAMLVFMGAVAFEGTRKD